MPHAPSVAANNVKKSLIALAIGTFALGIAEFSMMGLLGDVAKSLDISVVKAGHLISAYSLGVAIGAPGLILLRKWPLKRLMLLLACMIAIGNLGASVSPNFICLLCSRFLSGLPHGAYFGAGAIVCSRIVGNKGGAEAVAVMVGGMTIANLVGVPGSTLIGNLFTWRIAFAVVAFFGLAALFFIHLWLPKLEPLPDTGVRGQFAFLSKREPWLIYAGVFFGQASVYCWFSYIDPIMTRVTGFTTDDMTWIMVVAGAGMVFGNFLAGRLADRYNAAAVTAVIATLVAFVMPSLFFASHIKWLSVVLTFIATACLFGIGGPLQYLIVRFAKGGEMLGGAGIQIAFNVSNAMAAALGGAAIHAGLGLASPALVGIPCALIGATALFTLRHRMIKTPL